MKKILLLFILPLLLFSSWKSDIAEFGYFCENISFNEGGHVSNDREDCSSWETNLKRGETRVHKGRVYIYIYHCKEIKDGLESEFWMNTYTCDDVVKTIPNCDDNQTLDTENNICIDNPPPEDDDNKTTPPEDDDNKTIPPEYDLDLDGIPDELDPDIDGDGTSNSDDDTPYGDDDPHNLNDENFQCDEGIHRVDAPCKGCKFPLIH